MLHDFLEPKFQNYITDSGRKQGSEHGKLYPLDQIEDTRNNIQAAPEELRKLYTLASNFYWVWNRKIRDVFEKIDPAAWAGVGYNPIQLLKQLGKDQLQDLSTRRDFLSSVAEAYSLQKRYLGDFEGTWFNKTYGIMHRNYLVAYFSAEFGVASCLRTYSGGLGILSGDHLKSASDLGIPLVGVGIFYRRGYFSQDIGTDGWQTESYPENDVSVLAVEPVMARDSDEPLVISVHVKNRLVRVRAWEVLVGRLQLFLLDTNLPGLNSKADCEITAELYGGDIRTRIEQEIVLGIGGAKLLHSLGIEPTLFHMNEGHSAFVSLERIGQALDAERGVLSLQKARDRIRASSLFTTHTPVPAGIDIFPKDLFLESLGYYARKFEISEDELFAMGQENEASTGFNMAVFAIRHSSDVNAVSKLHKDVARRIWKGVLDEESFSSGESGDRSTGHMPARRISSVTNGIHVPSWVSDQMASLYDQYVGEGWMDSLADADIWNAIYDLPDEILWRVRSSERNKLVSHIRDNFSNGSGLPSEKVLDPQALTIGFARRFATYKRANLILTDKARLEKILCDTSRPVQIVFAGKAHPRDHEGKRLIQEIYNFTRSSDRIYGKIIFLPDYDISIARSLVQGVDLWLNNPRRPLEACGTSGMKVLANGGLNLSVLDGWWDEAFSPNNGWAIGTGIELSDVAEQDRTDCEALYDLLENRVIPEFYDRNEKGVPTRWTEKVKHSIATLAPRFNTRRMVMEYAQRFYFKDDFPFANKLNRSELGVELLEGVSPDWEH